MGPGASSDSNSDEYQTNSKYFWGIESDRRVRLDNLTNICECSKFPLMCNERAAEG
jgi:hypothetical protein